MDFRMQDRMDKMNNTASVMKQVVVLVGAGSIGQAIVRRVAAGKHVVLADYSLEHAQQAATAQRVASRQFCAHSHDWDAAGQERVHQRHRNGHAQLL